LGKLKIFLLRQFDALVSISNRVQKRIENFGFENARMFTIPNGVDERFFLDQDADKEARGKLIKTHQLNENARIISSMGSIEYRKGVDVLARAWPRIISQIPESRLLMVGPFFEQTRFHQQLVSLLGEHLGKTVFLVGNVPDPECYYRASDVFAFPSRNESFGNVLVEAMACGRACVAALIDGVTESIIQDGYNGIIINQEDHEALAKAVGTILTHPHLECQLGENAANTVKEKYRIDTIAESYQHLYRSLLSGNCA
jgi:glycosyltransferase involved in cell wall biosynthesis